MGWAGLGFPDATDTAVKIATHLTAFVRDLSTGLGGVREVYVCAGRDARLSLNKSVGSRSGVNTL
jgi:hypothetical protein